METTQDLHNQLTRPVQLWRLKIVPDAEPNADGEWIDVGTAQLRRDVSFSATVEHFADKIPAGMHVVAVDAKDL